MTITTNSGLHLHIPGHHLVFKPIGAYNVGDKIDPSTVDFTRNRVTTLRRGDRIIVNNRVELVDSVSFAA